MTRDRKGGREDEVEGPFPKQLRSACDRRGIPADLRVRKHHLLQHAPHPARRGGPSDGLLWCSDVSAAPTRPWPVAQATDLQRTRTHDRYLAAIERWICRVWRVCRRQHGRFPPE